MGITKDTREKIDSLFRNIEEHEEAIKREEEKANPNRGLIHHWSAEIEAKRQRADRLQRRLAIRRRRG